MAQGAGKGAQHGEKEDRGVLVALHSSLTGRDTEGDLGSAPGNSDTTRETASSCAKESLDGVLGKIS